VPAVDAGLRVKTPAETVIDLYSRRALEFDTDRNKTLFERPWLDAFLAHVPEAGTLLDLGCGSGEPIARHLIDQGRLVTGVDAAPDLISLCRKRFAAQEWIVADMRYLDLGRMFDGVLVWHSAIHLTPDAHRGMFDVYRRHVRPGGVLMFTSAPEGGEWVGEWRGEPLYHGGLSSEACEAGLDAAGFEVLAHRVNDSDCGGATVWLARRRVSDCDYDRQTFQSNR